MIKDMTRRDFIRSSVMGVAGTAVYRRIPVMPVFEEKPRIKSYRILGRTGMRVSDVSLGAAVPQDADLIRYLLDGGVNYIDTAERYRNGQSERVVGEAVKGRRKDVYITTKLAVRENTTAQEWIDRFHRCLDRLQTDYADVLMIHGVAKTEELTLPFVHEAFQRLKSDGKVRFLGLSCHEPRIVDICNAAIEDGRFDVLLLVYNFMQEKAESVLKHAAQKGVGTTIMKVHASEHPEQLRTVSDEERLRLQEEADERTWYFRKKYNLEGDAYYRAAIAWVLKNPSVGCVVASIRTFDQADDYLSVSGKRFFHHYRSILNRYGSRMHRRYCRHACGLCEPFCPHGVAVNDILRIHAYYTNYRQEDVAIQRYAELNRGRKATFCFTCSGVCEKHCPYGVSIRRRLVAAHEDLVPRENINV